MYFGASLESASLTSTSSLVLAPSIGASVSVSTILPSLVVSIIVGLISENFFKLSGKEFVKFINFWDISASFWFSSLDWNLVARLTP